MADPHSEATSFETRLEAMDRRLRELQAEIGPGPAVGLDGPPPESSAEVPVAGLSAAESDGSPTQMEVVVELYGKLVASMRELLGGYELVAEQLLPGRPAPAPAPAPGGDHAGVALSAGPFAGTTALREFEQALAALPGVETVALRGYEADNRAIFDVQLR
jgi:hypothetical protein